MIKSPAPFSILIFYNDYKEQALDMRGHFYSTPLFLHILFPPPKGAGPVVRINSFRLKRVSGYLLFSLIFIISVQSLAPCNEGTELSICNFQVMISCVTGVSGGGASPCRGSRLTVYTPQEKVMKVAATLPATIPVQIPVSPMSITIPKR